TFLWGGAGWGVWKEVPAEAPAESPAAASQAVCARGRAGGLALLPGTHPSGRYLEPSSGVQSSRPCPGVVGGQHPGGGCGPLGSFPLEGYAAHTPRWGQVPGQRELRPEGLQARPRESKVN
uniref:Uncharacterized protein n=1 Tax=Mustela putorius furo TaxID=9669 RepID=M3YAV0_MUSPF